jgi:hypothetical protein
LEKVKKYLHVSQISIDRGDISLECLNRAIQNYGLWQQVMKEQEYMSRDCLNGGSSLSCLIIAIFSLTILYIMTSRAYILAPGFKTAPVQVL